MSQTLTRTRELSSRTCDGMHVRLLWRATDDQLFVTVDDRKADHRFAIPVEQGERPLEVFNHPYAYAAALGLDTE
jgi:hypothetical protein